MDISWSPDDSSSFVQSENDSEVDQNRDVQNTSEHGRRSRRNGLLDIDDSDFEALIEIFGTDGDRQNQDVRSLWSGGVHDRRWPAQSESTRQLVARETGGTNTVGTRPLRDDTPCSPSRGVPKPMKQLLTTDANHDSGPSGSRAANRERQPTPPQEGSFQLPSPTRTSSPVRTQFKRQGRTIHSPSSRGNVGFTQSKQELGISISEVKGQLAELRLRVQVLKGEVKEFAPHVYRRTSDSAGAEVQRPASGEDERPPHRHDAKGKGKAVVRPIPPNGHLQQSEAGVISSLTEGEAKTALDNICQALRIDPKDLALPSMQNRAHDLLLPPSNLSDVVRALNLVADLDDLVWRRRDSRPGPSRAHPTYDIYEEENINALLDRVRLWERTARSRAGRQNGQ